MTTGADAAESRRRNQQVFGANAANYATSAVHAKGASLTRLVEVVGPQPSWRMLDIATAAGHTALTFAPFVDTVVATDLTREMVALTRRRAAEAGVSNVVVAQVDAGVLPFPDATFDAVTCRIAPHHFPDPAAFVRDTARVARRGGVVAIVDNTVPTDAEAARWYNDWERRRDPSHRRCLSPSEWHGLLADAGLAVHVSETAPKLMEFSAWTANTGVADDVADWLLADLLDAPFAVGAFLEPSGTSHDDATFVLTELLIAATR